MPSLLAPPRPVQPTRSAPEPRGRCRLTLSINGTDYRVAPVRSDWHARAFALRKADGALYHVAADEHGPSCDCPDATYRERRCKHVMAMQALGLL
jgi:hypothetical protein